MSLRSAGIYESAGAYFEAPDGMKNEVTMWFVAGGLLVQELATMSGARYFGGLKSTNGLRLSKTFPKIDILDVCSGPGNFLNHLQIIYPNFSATCIDQNKFFLEAGRTLFCEWNWILGDVVTIDLRRKFDVVSASSAYHHIIDEQKVIFLQNMRKHLKDGGFLLMCENFLPGYLNERRKKDSVDKYYTELIRYFERGNATDVSLDRINEVWKLERNNVEEHKVSFDIFLKQITAAGFIIYNDVVVWQPTVFKKDDAGSHVLLLKKCK